MKFILPTCFSLLLCSFSMGETECPSKCKKDGEAKCESKSDASCEKKCESKCSAKKIHFAVKGEGCSKSLSGAITEMEGVTVEKACGHSGAVVIAAEGEVCKKSLCEAVKASGFEVLGEKVTVPVSGMTCGGCETKLSKVLAKVEGVTVERVCSKSGTATMVIDSEQVSQDQVLEVIQKSGFNKGV